MASRKTSVAPPVSATFPVDRSQVSVAPRRSVRTSKQNLTLIQEDSQKEILRKVLDSQRPPRTSSRFSIGQTRPRSRSSSCDVDVTAKSKNVSRQLPLPPLVGVQGCWTPSSTCHFDDSSISVDLRLWEPRDCSGHTTDRSAVPSHATGRLRLG